MKYPIRENAMSSLDIAIRHFKLFFFNKCLSPGELQDHVKISIIMLQNSIELFLKSVLIINNPESIYRKPNSAIIRQTKEMVEKSVNGSKLEDFLLQHAEDLQTIGYWDALKKYDEKYPMNKRANDILGKLGVFRNAITHYGIDFSNRFDDLLCCFTESFDVIYNHLYPQLISLDDVGDFFTEDDMYVATPHGMKPLFDENFIYNNIVDFLDELEEITQDYVRKVCCSNPKRRIKDFIKLLNSIIASNDFQSFLCKNNLKIELNEEDCSCNMYLESDGLISISHYSTYHNATIIMDDAGFILFSVEHTENKLYVYDTPQYYPSIDKAENYYQWRTDANNEYCKCIELNYDNLAIALNQAITMVL